MKIVASSIIEFQKIEEVLALIGDKKFVDSFEEIELHSVGFLKCSTMLWVEKIEIPKSIQIRSVKFLMYKKYEENGSKNLYQVEVNGEIKREDGKSPQTLIMTYYGFSSPNIEIVNKYH